MKWRCKWRMAYYSSAVIHCNEVLLPCAIPFMPKTRGTLEPTAAPRHASTAKLMTMHGGHHIYCRVHVLQLRHHVERLSCRDSWWGHYGTVSCFPPSVQTAQRADHPHREERPFRRVDTQRARRSARCRRESGQRVTGSRPTNHPVQLQAHPRAGTCFSPRTHPPKLHLSLQIHLLDLRSEVLSTPRASPAGRNRFLHVPPTQALQALPSSILTALTLPLGRLVLRSVLSEPFARANTPADDSDESVDAFFTRRFGATFARTLGSALVHGIYAADSRELSVTRCVSYATRV
jgi:hypothetical protein